MSDLRIIITIFKKKKKKKKNTRVSCWTFLSYNVDLCKFQFLKTACNYSGSTVKSRIVESFSKNASSPFAPSPSRKFPRRIESSNVCRVFHADFPPIRFYTLIAVGSGVNASLSTRLSARGDLRPAKNVIRRMHAYAKDEKKRNGTLTWEVRKGSDGGSGSSPNKNSRKANREQTG